ncbi:MAG: hypothetical protein CL423_03555 [Acidimicrobiaceae bacterium]|nr:hypothetical protein [Acidimicrobiaceae bacterium]
MEITSPTTGDFVAGISVALLALPQGLAYAELAGVPAQYGLYAAALPCLLAALFASSPYLQTGPVAVTALLTFGALQGVAEPQTSEYVELAALLALFVGIIRLAFGILRLGKIANLLSDYLILGFTSGAAILIVFSQLPKALGVETSNGGVIRSGFNALIHPAQWHGLAILFSIGTILFMFGGRRVHRLFPGVLVAVVAGILISWGINYSGSVVGELEGGFITFDFAFEWSSTSQLIFPAFVIAVVGFAEPASIARTFEPEGKASWNSDREMISQGVANMASAISQAFPVGGSFGRSALNHFAGATTTWSGAITGASVLLALPFTFLLESLPSSILGATVIGAVVRLIRPKDFYNLLQNSYGDAAVGFGTLIATLVTAPRIERGILIGLFFSLLNSYSQRANASH